MDINKIDRKKFKNIREMGNKIYGDLLVEKAEISPYNVRPEVTMDDAKDLAESIDEEGLLQTPLCTPNGEIFVGGRRLKAIEYNKKNVISVEIRDYTPAQQWRASLAENTKRKGITINEEGRALKNIRDQEGLSLRQMEKKEIGGRSKTEIGAKIQIFEEFEEKPLSRGGTPIEVITGTGKPSDSKEITFEKAKALVPLKKRDREILVEKIQDKGLTKSQVTSKIKKTKVIRELIASVDDDEKREFLEKEIEPVIYEDEMTKEVAEKMVMKVEGLLIVTPEVIIAFHKIFPQIENFCKMFPIYGKCSSEDKEKETIIDFKITLPKKLLEVKSDVSEETVN